MKPIWPATDSVQASQTYQGPPRTTNLPYHDIKKYMKLNVILVQYIPWNCLFNSRVQIRTNRQDQYASINYWVVDVVHYKKFSLPTSQEPSYLIFPKTFTEKTYPRTRSYPGCQTGKELKVNVGLKLLIGFAKSARGRQVQIMGVQFLPYLSWDHESAEEIPQRVEWGGNNRCNHMVWSNRRSHHAIEGEVQQGEVHEEQKP